MSERKNRKTDRIWLDPARTIIERVGGIEAAAAATGKDYTRVYRWMRPRAVGGTDGLIPSRYHRDLLDYARKHGQPLKPDDFFCAA